jgi:4-amino-4-deoxy-L-arabinose transferase-like glycosyltransferase
LLAAALACGAISFRAFAASPGAWSWLLCFAAAAALAVAALSDRTTFPVETTRRRRARHAAGAAALLFAAAALVAIPVPGRELPAALASVAALVCFAAARWVPFTADDVLRLIGPDEPGARISRGGKATRFAVALLAVACGAAALRYNEGDPRRGFALWLLSLSLFAAANLPAGRPVRAGAVRRDESGPPISRPAEFAAFLAILTAAAFLRFLWLDRFPELIEGDEGRQALSAEAMWSRGFPNVFDIGWNSFPNLSYVVEWAGVQLFGKSNVNFRLSAALIGTLSLVPLHLWARRWWGGVVAVIATLLLAINREHLLWSRWAFNNIHVVLLAGLVLATFARVLRSRRTIDWVWFGFALGLGFHTYHAAKLHPLLIAAAALVLALGIPGFARRYAAGAVVGAIAFALCIGPHSATVARKWEILTRENNRFDVDLLAAAWHAGDVAATRDYVFSHVAGCLTVFSHYWGTREAFFAPVVAVPFWLGVCWLAWRWRDPRHLVVLLWMGGILVIGGMVTSYPPWKPRLLGLLPAACVTAALVAARARALLWRAVGARADYLWLPLLAAWIGAALWHTLDTEFVYRPFRQRGEIMTSLGRAIEALPLPGSAFLLGAEPLAVVHHATIADDPRRRLSGPALDADSVPVAPDAHGNVVYLVTREQRRLLPLLRHYYPDAHTRTVENLFEETVLWSFSLDPARLAGHRVLRRGPIPGGATARWRGSLFVAESGPHSLRARDGVVHIDERALAATEEIWLAAGWHSLAVDAAAANPRQPRLEWTRPRAPHWSPVEPGYFSDHAIAHGLLGRYFTGVRSAPDGVPIDATPDGQRISTALSFEWSSPWNVAPPAPLLAPPATMEWVGSVRLAAEGDQALRLTTTAPARLFLNGKLILAAAGGKPAQSIEAEIDVAPGPIETLLRVTWPENEPHEWILALEWRQPGGDWSAFADYRPPPARVAGGDAEASQGRRTNPPAPGRGSPRARAAGRAGAAD